MNWFFDNLGTLLTGIVLLAIVTSTVLYLMRAKKRGESSCGCGCGSCAMRGSCHKAAPNPPAKEQKA